MYYLLFILIILTLLCSIIFHFRKKRIICKINAMEKCEKCSLLEEIVNPFGYCYYCKQGVFSSTLDAWQKKAGYTYLYDYMAPRFQMVFDRLPVYFDYNGKTWLIEFWKGQYGINTGAEIGVYHADRILSPGEYQTTLFTGANDTEIFPLSFLLYNQKGRYIQIKQKHWWLTTFLTGCYSEPKDLYMECYLTFPNIVMQNAFLKGLQQAGFSSQEISVCGLCVSFYFYKSIHETATLLTRFRRRLSQWKNRNFCRLYLRITNPFSTTEDRVLYLYYYLPFAFRRLLRMHRFNKRCHRRKRCMKRTRI